MDTAGSSLDECPAAIMGTGSPSRLAIWSVFMDDMSADLEDCRRVVFFRDRETGQRGITVLHDTRLGPALGACRSRPYDRFHGRGRRPRADHQSEVSRT